MSKKSDSCHCKKCKKQGIEPPAYRRGWNAAIKAVERVAKGVVKRDQDGAIIETISASKHIQRVIHGMRWG